MSGGFSKFVSVKIVTVLPMKYGYVYFSFFTICLEILNFLNFEDRGTSIQPNVLRAI